MSNVFSGPETVRLDPAARLHVSWRSFMPTIKEVADRAGVSVGTVSHVITGSVTVSESLRRKVQAAIQELNYHPNHVARSLKTSRTRTLGIMVPDVTIPFFPQVIRGAESAAAQRSYSLLAVN